MQNKRENGGNNVNSACFCGDEEKTPQTSKNSHPVKNHKQPSTDVNDLVNYYIDKTSKAVKPHRQQQK